MKITFLGATGTVTGSCYLLETSGLKILIDFGLYQEENEDNSEISFNPKEIDAVLLTHSHIDHVGRIPLLFKKGFKGKVYCTNQTKELAVIMLKDSANIQERATELENESRIKAGLDKKEPLYNTEDVEISLSYFYPIPFNKKESFKNIIFEFIEAGHILGAASILVDVKENTYHETICFSGDLGNSGNLLLDPPKFNGECDYLVMESTYGNRVHEDVKLRSEKLGDILLDIYNNKEIGIIPTFSLGRTQNIILELKKLLKTDKYRALNSLPIYIDSPLGMKATTIYENNKEALKNNLVNDSNLFHLDNAHFLEELKETFTVIRSDNPKLIISSSGMCNGGKIMFYLKEFLKSNLTNIIFIGYQAENTLGRKILEKNTSVFINKKEYKVNAKIHKINGYSAHADQTDLINFVTNLKKSPDIIFITHGENDSREILKEKLAEKGYRNIILPEKNKQIQM
ncbi:MBL fold metallo-hydrolase [Clostridiaceae bacterium HSG29]|nr:MBL fold metallo-hydrolase [Clostridiaceae bacterium HSG29]